MQNRYAGDVGDFGKLGMLRCIEKNGIRVGVNWYLVGDESHNNDGKHVGYLKDKKYCGCDEEIIDYYKNGHSVVFYSHRTREKLEVYLKRFEKLFAADEFEFATIKGVSFKRGTVRDYFFILHKEHAPQIEQAIREITSGIWSKHFSSIIE